MELLTEGKINLALDPASGPGYIKQQFPELTNYQAKMAFWQMKMRDIDMGGNSVDENSDYRKAHEEWKTWMSLKGEL